MDLVSKKSSLKHIINEVYDNKVNYFDLLASDIWYIPSKNRAAPNLWYIFDSKEVF